MPTDHLFENTAKAPDRDMITGSIAKTGLQRERFWNGPSTDSYIPLHPPTKSLKPANAQQPTQQMLQFSS